MIPFLIAAWVVVSFAVVLGLGRWFRHLRLLDEAIRRHPAGHRLPDAQPFTARALCCGSRIYGDTLSDLDENFRYHLTQCPVRKEAS